MSSTSSDVNHPAGGIPSAQATDTQAPQDPNADDSSERGDDSDAAPEWSDREDNNADTEGTHLSRKGMASLLSDVGIHWGDPSRAWIPEAYEAFAQAFAARTIAPLRPILRVPGRPSANSAEDAEKLRTLTEELVKRTREWVQKEHNSERRKTVHSLLRDASFAFSKSFRCNDDTCQHFSLKAPRSSQDLEYQTSDDYKSAHPIVDKAKDVQEQERISNTVERAVSRLRHMFQLTLGVVWASEAGVELATYTTFGSSPDDVDPWRKHASLTFRLDEAQLLVVETIKASQEDHDLRVAAKRGSAPRWLDNLVSRMRDEGLAVIGSTLPDNGSDDDWIIS